MQVFVAGATGALGRRIVPRLLARGHRVTGVGRSRPQLDALAALGATAVPLDLFDAPALERAMQGHDAVINVATRVPSPTRMLFPGAWRAMDRVRTEGARLIAASAMRNGIGRLVQESFAPIYPDCGVKWITEQIPARPARYNRSVTAAESAALGVARAGVDAVILRFAMLYGPNDPVAGQVLSSIRRGWSPFLGRPDGYLPFVTHDDAADAVVASLDVPAGIYNVVDDEPMTRHDLVESLARVLEVRRVRVLPSWVAKLAGSLGETLARSLRISNRKLKGASSWAPATPSAREGFRAMVEGG